MKIDKTYRITEVPAVVRLAWTGESFLATFRTGELPLTRGELIELRDALTAAIDLTAAPSVPLDAPVGRLWNSITDVPADVQRVKDCTGNIWVRNQKCSSEWTYQNSFWYDTADLDDEDAVAGFGPFTEIPQ